MLLTAPICNMTDPRGGSVKTPGPSYE